MIDAHMQRAIEEAQKTKTEGGQPFGAVLIRGNKMIGVGHNRAIQNNDPISHGEIEAIRDAGLQDTYADTTLYTTAFPCLMCAGASWEGSAPSRAFMESHGIELIELRLDTCYQLLE